MKAFILVLGISLLLTACREKAAQNKPSAEEEAVTSDLIRVTSEQMKNAGITVGMPQRKAMTENISVTGFIDVPPSNRISISIPLGGYLKKTNLLPGTRIRKGEIIAVMEDNQYIQLQQDYLLTRTRLEFLELDYKRQQELNSDKSISDKSFQQVRANYLAERISLKALEEKLRLLNIDPVRLTAENISRAINVYSPVDGFVSAINVNVGKYAEPSDVLFELIDGRRVHVILTIFEKDLLLVSPGLKLQVSTTTSPEKKYVAVVRSVNKSLDKERSSEVYCDFENMPEDLLPGMFVTATIQLTSGLVTAVPEEAVVSWDNKKYVFVKKQAGTFSMNSVETGMNDEGFVEIKNLAASTELVTSNAYSLLMKAKGVTDE